MAADIQKNAQLLAEELSKALQADGFTKQATFTESAVRRSRTARVLKEAEERLDLIGATEDEKDDIADSASDKIRSRRGYLRQMMKEASNDNALDLARLMDQLFGR